MFVSPRVLVVWLVFVTAGVGEEFRPVIEAGAGQELGGRLFLIASRKPIEAGIAAQNWFSPEPFFAQSESRGASVRFTPDRGFPHPLAQLPKGTYYFQAVLDRDRGGQNALTSAGNRYSKPVRVDFDPATPPSDLRFVLTETIAEKPFPANDRVRLFERESPRLTAFHKRPISLRAGVVLPKNYDATVRYPIVYEIPGFGGTHHLAFAALGRNATNVAGVEMIHVVLDPAFRTGHHVFANSANNGPVGDALVHEFLPALERAFGGERTAKERFLTGHSSGGWSSLWLQIQYPDHFAGVWSTAPDSVDFRDFQLVNIYEPNTNLFIDANQKLRPLARKDGKVALTYRQFSDMENVLGRGGQLFSFEAVFSPRGPDGQPRKLWNRATGAIDPETAAAWKAYDIRLILEQNWPTLGPKLKGKIHIFMGDEDTFFLDGATRLLKASLEKLGSDAVIEMIPGKHHGNLLDPALRARIAREMAATSKR